MICREKRETDFVMQFRFIFSDFKLIHVIVGRNVFIFSPKNMHKNSHDNTISQKQSESPQINRNLFIKWNYTAVRTKEPKLYATTGMNLMNMVMYKGSQAQMSTHHVIFIYIMLNREFPGGPVVRTQRSHFWGPRFNPWSGK